MKETLVKISKIKAGFLRKKKKRQTLSQTHQENKREESYQQN